MKMGIAMTGGPFFFFAFSSFSPPPSAVFSPETDSPSVFLAVSFSSSAA